MHDLLYSPVLRISLITECWQLPAVLPAAWAHPRPTRAAAAGRP